MNSPQMTSSQIPLAHTATQLQAQVEQACALLERIMQQQQAQTSLLRDMLKLIDGFTAGGASFTAYQLDPMILAYMAIAGPQFNRVLSSCDADIVEILKAAGPLSRRVIEEYDAYRSQRGGLDYLEEQGALIDDPWESSSPQS